MKLTNNKEEKQIDNMQIAHPNTKKDQWADPQLSNMSDDIHSEEDNISQKARDKLSVDAFLGSADFFKNISIY